MLGVCGRVCAQFTWLSVPSFLSPHFSCSFFCLAALLPAPAAGVSRSSSSIFGLALTHTAADTPICDQTLFVLFGVECGLLPMIRFVPEQGRPLLTEQTAIRSKRYSREDLVIRVSFRTCCWLVGGCPSTSQAWNIYISACHGEEAVVERRGFASHWNGSLGSTEILNCSFLLCSPSARTRMHMCLAVVAWRVRRQNCPLSPAETDRPAQSMCLDARSHPSSCQCLIDGAHWSRRVPPVGQNAASPRRRSPHGTCSAGTFFLVANPSCVVP